jgi:rhomboid protease GluP
MFKRQTSGSVVCASCGYLVGVKDDRCYHCGRRNPALFGYATALRNLGHDAGFVPFVTGFCVLMYLISMLLGRVFAAPGSRASCRPGPRGLFLLGESGTVPVIELHRWWTIFSASWLPRRPAPYLLNLMWIRQLAPGRRPSSTDPAGW